MSTLPVTTPTRGGSGPAEPHSAASGLACTGLVVLITVVPLETVEPLVVLPGQAISSAEVALIVVLAAWLAACARSGEWPAWRTALTPAWIALIAAWSAAALLAPAFGGNALHMAGRVAMACAVFLLTVNAVTSWERLRAVGVTSAVSGVVLSALVLLDFAAIEPVRTWLASFRPFVAHVGAQVRASGPFHYPTIASMYLEVLFAWSIPLLALAIDARRHWLAVVTSGALLVMSQASVSTFTRAGAVTMLASLGVVAWCRYRARGIDVVVRWLAALALLLVVQFAVSRSLESLWLRLSTESTNAWYAASIDAPDRLEIPAGATRTVTLTVTNVGRLTWDSTLPQPFRLSYHWLTEDGTQVVSWEGRRTLFPHAVPPGSRVTLAAQIGAPRQPGQYRVLWDVELERRLWFSTEPGASLTHSSAVVTGPAVGALPPLSPLPRPLQQGESRPGRRALWSAAVQMAMAHPVTGVGPDNFRLLYGPYLGIREPDTRIHSNSMYLEVLAGTGALGGAAFLLVGWRIAQVARRALARPDPTAPAHASDTAALASGVVAGAVAIAVHGLVDSFLSFTATYVLIAIALGLIACLDTLSRPHAHRL